MVMWLPAGSRACEVEPLGAGSEAVARVIVVEAGFREQWGAPIGLADAASAWDRREPQAWVDLAGQEEFAQPDREWVIRVGWRGRRPPADWEGSAGPDGEASRTRVPSSQDIRGPVPIRTALDTLRAASRATTPARSSPGRGVPRPGWSVPVAAGWCTEDHSRGAPTWWWWTAGPVGDRCTLDGAARGGPVSVPVLARWCLDLLHSAVALHAAGVAHLDIKPDNVLMDRGRATLMDFGLLTHIKPGTPTAWGGRTWEEWLLDEADHALFCEDEKLPVLGTPGAVAPWLTNRWLRDHHHELAQANLQGWAEAADLWAVLNMIRDLLPPPAAAPVLMRRHRDALSTLLDTCLGHPEADGADDVHPDRFPRPHPGTSPRTDDDDDGDGVASGGDEGAPRARLGRVISFFELEARLAGLAVGPIPPRMALRGAGIPDQLSTQAEAWELFTGRKVQTARVHRHLAGRYADAPGLVVAGRPGDGKTALLGHIAADTMDDPDLAADIVIDAGDIPHLDTAADTRTHSVVGTGTGTGTSDITANDLNRRQPATAAAVAAWISACLPRQSHGGPSGLIGQIESAAQRWDRPVRIIIDALDEAATEPTGPGEPTTLPTGVGLARAVTSWCQQLHAAHLRVVIGVRTDTPAADALARGHSTALHQRPGPAGAGHAVPGEWVAGVDLAHLNNKEGQQQARDDLAEYLGKLLDQLIRDPYSTPPAESLGSRDHSADLARIAAAADGNFLIGQFSLRALADDLALRRPLPTDLPTTAEGAFALWLFGLADGLDRQATADVLLLLTTLALTGSTPRLQLPRLMGALTGHHDWTNERLDDLLEGGGPAAARFRPFLTTSHIDPVQRGQHLTIFHAQFDKWLRETTPAHLDWLAHHNPYTILVDELTTDSPAGVDIQDRAREASARWASRAIPRLAGTAAKYPPRPDPGPLNRLLAQPLFLRDVDPDDLTPHLQATGLDPIATTYRAAAHALRRTDCHSRLAIIAAHSDSATERRGLVSPVTTDTVLLWAHATTAHPIAVIDSGAGGPSARHVVVLPRADGHSLLATWHDGGRVRVWDPLTGTPHRSDRDGFPVGGGVEGMVVLPRPDDHPLLATRDRDGRVRVWDPLTGTPHRSDRDGFPVGGDVRGMVVLPRPDDHPLLATRHWDGRVRVWDPLTGTPHRSDRDGLPVGGGVEGMVAVPRPDDHPLLATRHRDGRVRVWDPLTGTPHRSDRDGLPVGGGVEGMVAVPRPDDHPLLATRHRDGRVRVWDPLTGTPHRSDRDGFPVGGYVEGMVVLPRPDDHPLLAARHRDGRVRVWDPLTGTPHRSDRDGFPVGGDVEEMVAVPRPDDHPLLATRDWDGRVRVWDPLTGTPHRSDRDGFPVGGYVEEMVAVPRPDDHPLLAARHRDGRVRVWDPLTGTPHRSDRDGFPVGGYVRGMVVLPRPDDHPLLATRHWDGRVRVWDPLTGTPHRSDRDGFPVGGGVEGMVAVPRPDDHPLLATRHRDGRVRVWDPLTGTPHRSDRDGFPVGGDVSGMVAVPRPDDHPLLATRHWDGRVRVWDPLTGTPHRSDRDGFPVGGYVEGMVAVPRPDDHPLLATRDRDGRVRVWDPLTGTPHRSDRDGFPVGGDVEEMVALPRPDDHPLLATTHRDGAIRVWNPDALAKGEDQTITTAAASRSTAPRPIRQFCLAPGHLISIGTTPRARVVVAHAFGLAALQL